MQGRKSIVSFGGHAFVMENLAVTVNVQCDDVPRSFLKKREILGLDPLSEKCNKILHAIEFDISCVGLEEYLNPLDNWVVNVVDEGGDHIQYNIQDLAESFSSVGSYVTSGTCGIGPRGDFLLHRIRDQINSINKYGKLLARETEMGQIGRFVIETLLIETAIYVRQCISSLVNHTNFVQRITNEN